MFLDVQVFLLSRKPSSRHLCQSLIVALNNFGYQMELHLKIIGTLLIILAFIHAIFPKYFNWKQELNSLSIINRQLMYVHSFFIAFVVLLMGVLCLTWNILDHQVFHTVLWLFSKDLEGQNIWNNCSHPVFCVVGLPEYYILLHLCWLIEHR